MRRTNSTEEDYLKRQSSQLTLDPCVKAYSGLQKQTDQVNI